jgi:hypothetical protein
VHHAIFPPSLDGVPPHAKITETFGFTLVSLALGALVGLAGAVVAVLTHGFRDMRHVYVGAACLVGAVVFGIAEVLRRRRRVALAFTGTEVGIYRDGVLAGVVPRQHIAIRRLSARTTLRELGLFGVLGPMSTLASFGLLGTDLALGLGVLAVGLGSLAALASTIYARIMCRHFAIPSGRVTEAILLTRSDAQRVGL